MQFTEIPGLWELKNQLIAAYQRNKVAHGQLFFGISGTSAMPMAIAYATYLLCNNKNESDSCGTCSNCIRIKKHIHPDVHLIFPKVSSTGINFEKQFSSALKLFRSFLMQSPFGTLEDWAWSYGQENKNLLISREDSRHIQRIVSMKSLEGNQKILILWCPEMMNISSANAILKILEEPPENTIYLLVSYDKEKLISTIISRLQQINIAPNQEEEIRDFLIKKGTDSSQAMQIANKAEGRIGLALQKLDITDDNKSKDFQYWMRECWTKDYSKLIKRSDEFALSSKTHQRNIFIHAITIVRASVLYIGNIEPNVVDDEEKQFIIKFSENTSLEILQKIYQIINETYNSLERNANPKISHLNTSLDICACLNS